MMNELKFRAWWAEAEEYVKVSGIDFTNEEIHYIEEYRNKTYSIDEIPFNEIIIEQYTGLKDKNGKEIYVGDIIDINQTVNGYNLFVITFENGLINVRYAHDMSQYEYDILELLDWDQLSLIETENEVVGNIHENKELL